jgi:hypothetical protein
MALIVWNPDRPNLRADLRVTQVGESSSLAEAECQYPKIRPGDRVSTRLQAEGS